MVLGNRGNVDLKEISFSCSVDDDDEEEEKEEEKGRFHCVSVVMVVEVVVSLRSVNLLAIAVQSTAKSTS